MENIDDEEYEAPEDLGDYNDDELGSWPVPPQSVQNDPHPWLRPLVD